MHTPNLDSILIPPRLVLVTHHVLLPGSDKVLDLIIRRHVVEVILRGTGLESGFVLVLLRLEPIFHIKKSAPQDVGLINRESAGNIL